LGVWNRLWQFSPPPRKSPNLVNYNLLSLSSAQMMLDLINVTRIAMFSQMETKYETVFVNETVIAADGPNILMITPVFENILLNNSTILGHTIALKPWHTVFKGILKVEQNGIVVVLEQSCGYEKVTYQINGANVVFLGVGDLHDTRYSSLVQNYSFSRFANDTLSPEGQEKLLTLDEICSYTVSIYPSQEVENRFTTNQPLWVMVGVLVVFAFTSLMFLLYDAVVQYRQSKLLALATKTSTIVASLFPAQVRDQLFGRLSTFDRRSTKNGESTRGDASEATSSSRKKSRNRRGKKKSKQSVAHSFYGYNNNSIEEFNMQDRPIADLFPNATVLFGKCSLQEKNM
jgi:hypothetical protein